MRRPLFAVGVILGSTACASSTSTSSKMATGGSCVMNVTAAVGANNVHPALTADGVSGDYTRSRTTIVCATLSQALEVSVTGPAPRVGVTYAVSPSGVDAGAAGTATVKYGESTMGSGSSTHVTWRGTAGTVTIDAAAKDTLTFRISEVTAEVDPESSGNQATGSLKLSGSGTVTDLLGFIP